MGPFLMSVTGVPGVLPGVVPGPGAHPDSEGVRVLGVSRFWGCPGSVGPPRSVGPSRFRGYGSGAVATSGSGTGPTESARACPGPGRHHLTLIFAIEVALAVAAALTWSDTAPWVQLVASSAVVRAHVHVRPLGPGLPGVLGPVFRVPVLEVVRVQDSGKEFG